MVAKCLNPHCEAQFQYLRGGKLFLVNSRDYRVRKDNRHCRAEYFWLCDSCAQSMTLNLKRLKPEVVPLPNQGGTEEFSAERYRRRMSISRNSGSDRGATVSPMRRGA
jgi:hypothetical protein